MDKQIASPIFIVAPSRFTGAFLAETLSRCPGAVLARGRLEAEISQRCGGRDRLTAADATPELVAALRDAVLTMSGELRLVDVAPRNAMRLPFLHAVFPEAQFVYVYQEPRGAVLEMRGNGEIPLRELAQRWSFTTSIVLDDLERLPSEAWMAAPHRPLLQAPDTTVGRVATFAGLEWDGRLPQRPEVQPMAAEPPADLAAIEEVAGPVAARARALFESAAARAKVRQTSPATSEEAKANAFRSVASQGFGDLLQRLGVTLVVSTYQSGFLIFVRADGGRVNTHFRNFRSPMGIALRNGQMVVATQRELWDYRNIPAVAQKVEPAGKHDACYLPRKMHVTGDIRIHEIGFAQDELWLVNTRFSALCTIDGDSSFVPRWRPPFISRLAAEDRCHLNGMALVDNRVRYVTALGVSDTANGWRENKARGGILMDVPSQEIVLRGLSMPHSPRKVGDDFYLLESGKGSLATADLATGKVETIAELPGFTRGLAFAGPFAFVGLSKVRESNIFGGIPLLERVAERECGIYAVDLRTGQVAGFLRFEGSVAEIFDVQVLHTRWPELVDVNDPLVVSSFGVPDEALEQFVA